MKNNIQDLKLFGIFGHPLSHTLSPVFQEAGFEKAGLLAHYLVFDLSPPTFKKVMRNLKKSPLKGFNLTVPYKLPVMKYLDWVTKEAEAIGAVNTVYRFGKKWYGTNTDAEGFWRSIREWGFEPKGKDVLILGAGGVARAATFALAKQKVRSITFWNRTVDNGIKLTKFFPKYFPKVLFKAEEWKAGMPANLAPFDLIINGTLLGLKKGDSSLIRSQDMPKQKKYFFDTIYNPVETEFLKLARKKGHKTLNGLPMLLYQGVRAFEIWTGKKAPIETMREALNKAINTKS